MKLNKSIKEAILNAALKKAGISEKRAAIRVRYAAWAESVRTQFATPEVAEKIKAAEELLKDIHPKLYAKVNVNSDPFLKINAGGQTRVIYWCGSEKYSNAKEPELKLVTPYDLAIPADGTLAQQLYAIDHSEEALEIEVQQLTLSLWAVLNSVTTDKKLIEIWPEAVAFIPAAEKANTPQLPSLPIAELNKLIGLP